MEGHDLFVERGTVDSRGLRTCLGAVVALAAVAGFALAGVALHELSYASGHPFAYGPAKVIALGAGAGALLALAILTLAIGLLRSAR
jgi:hypothetical protein